jgi:hypothetical protein
MRRLTIALACGALALMPACGGDDEDEPITAPELTVPRATDTETEANTTTDQTGTESVPSQPDSGGAQAPSTESQDSPQNDQPPPAGSPAERFEQFCEENPGACGD